MSGTIWLSVCSVTTNVFWPCFSCSDFFLNNKAWALETQCLVLPLTYLCFEGVHLQEKELKILPLDGSVKIYFGLSLCFLTFGVGNGQSPVAQRESIHLQWVGKIPWRRKWQPTSVSLPGKLHGQRSMASYNP